MYKIRVDGVEMRELWAGNEEYRHGGYGVVSQEIPRFWWLDRSSRLRKLH